METPVLFAFGLYFAVLLAIGLMAHRAHTTAADFMVGGRSLNYYVTALSAHASDMSSWLFMAFPMKVFLGGPSALWIAAGLLIGMFCNWQFVAPRLRVATETYGSFTLNSYLESRVGDKSGVLRMVGAVATLGFTIFYLAAGLMALGYLFEALFGINYYAGISIATAVVLAYTLFGGFVAVAWTDFFQACFLLVMITLVPVVAYLHVDEPQAIWEGVRNRQMQSGFLESILLALAWGLGYFGLPHVLTKFMGIKNPEEVTKAKRLGMSWQLLSLIASAAVGFVAIALYTPGQFNDELVFVHMVKQFFHPFMAGLILCGVLAATISTMDSQILVVSACMAEDIYRKFWRPDASSREVLLASRISVLAATLVALCIAFYRDQSIYERVFYAWSGLGCTFGPVMLLALLGKRLSKRGALAAMLSGAFTAGVWPSAAVALGLEIVPAMIPGFALALTAGRLIK